MTTGRFGVRVKVTSAVRSVHSLVTSRIPSTGSRKPCGVEVVPRKLKNVRWSLPPLSPKM